MEEKESNYEINLRHMTEEFLKRDQTEMIDKFCLKSDETYLYLTFTGRAVRVHRETGKIEWSPDGFQSVFCADTNAAMTIYDLLCDSIKGCRPGGNFKKIESLSSIFHTDKNLGPGLLKPSERFFDHRDRELADACVKLGGIPSGKGDVSYLIPIFDALFMQLRFWDSDEEFPASLDILWDSNVLQYLHYETVWYVSLYVLERLQKLMK